VANDRASAEASQKQPRISRKEQLQAIGRALKYLVVRGVAIWLTILVGIYVAIWVINLGGYGDQIRAEEIVNFVGSRVAQTPWETHWQRRSDAIASALHWADLDQPFWKRSFRYWREALTIDFFTRVDFQEVKAADDPSIPRAHFVILADRLPRSLLLFGTGNLISFLLSLLFALALAKRYGTWFDRLGTALLPILSVPTWFHGTILIVLFASIARILPFGRMLGPGAHGSTLDLVVDVLKHMVLPVSAFVLGTLPLIAHSTRSLFLLRSGEDYVELGKAKGLPARKLNRRYFIRPSLPPILTSFVLMTIVSWESLVLTEWVFNWPGIGYMLLDAINSWQIAVVTDIIALFAYLLGLSIFLLDIAYVVVDPRISLGKGGSS